jgi:DNA-binding NarL/FixJ family response regulator
LKRSVAAELVSAIHQVLEGKRYVSPGLNQEIGAVPPPKPAIALTSRQREVLQLVAEGRSVKQIAGTLGVSSKTVEFHKAALTQRLGIHSTAELTRYAIEHGDDKPDLSSA